MIRALVVSAVLLGLAACTRTPARDPAVVDDVVAYVAKIRKWEGVEAEVLRAIHDVRRSQYVDDDYVVSTLGAPMADIELHLEEIDHFRPRTAPVAQVHDRYVKAWHDLHDSFATIIAAMQRKDYRALADGTEAMGKARDELVTVAAALSLLMKDAGLKPENDEVAPDREADAQSSKQTFQSAPSSDAESQLRLHVDWRSRGLRPPATSAHAAPSAHSSLRPFPVT